MDDKVENIKEKNNQRTFVEASSDLRSWYGYVYADRHIPRIETTDLLNWVFAKAFRPEERVHLLVGEAGSGKSVILRDLLLKLEGRNVQVLGLKADCLFARQGDLDSLIGIGSSAVSVLRETAKTERVVLLIDQVDALSSSLSSNRSPLDSINTLVNELSSCENIKIILSCRPYDLNYDPALERYKLNTVTNVSPLPLDAVKETLRLANITISDEDVITLNFLTNPLNLFLFCRIQNRDLFCTQSPNRTILYEALWNQILINKSKTQITVSYQSLLSCLDDMTQEMYQRQVLSVSYCKLIKNYPNEICFLCSNSLLCNLDGQLQFIHQSLYDYIYACLFFQQNKTISDILDGVHQGLFIRLRLKQILFYLRDVDIDCYLENLNKLLFDKNQDGSDKYRFHLKHLMLTNIGYLDDLREEECEYLHTCVLVDSILAEVYIESVNSLSGLNFLIKEVNRRGGFSNMDENRQNQLLNACSRVMSVGKYRQPVLNYLIGLDSAGFKKTAKENLLNIINYMSVDASSIPLIIELVNKYDKLSCEPVFPLLYRKIVPFSPRFIGEKIIANVNYTLQNLESEELALNINFDDNIDSLLHNLHESDKRIAFDVTLKVVQLISRKSLLSSQESFPIKTSMAYICFNRHEGAYNLAEKALKKLLEQVENVQADELEDYKVVFKTLASSDLASDVLISVCGYRSNIEYFLQDAFEVLVRIIKSEPISSVLEYYSRELFRVLFPNLEKCRKDKLMQYLEDFNPKWEKNYSKQNPLERPLTFIGYSKAHYYRMLSEGELINYPNARRHLHEMRHKYGDLENKEPYETSVKIGWTSLSQDAYNEMSVSDMVNSMVGITENNSINWDKPSLTGHAMALRDHLSSRPKDYYDAYMEAIDKGANVTYILYGVESLLDNGYDIESINILTDKVVAKLDKRVCENDPGLTIQVMRLIDRYCDKGTRAPESLFDFTCEVATLWDDSEYKTEAYVNNSYNDGINQVRGCAADCILRCYRDLDRADKIFDVLSIVAENGAVSTRSAVLFRMAVLFDVDKEKCKNLFLILTKDYATSLLNLPLHNLNPLLRLISYDFKALYAYFDACINNPNTHKVNVTLLWISWVRRQDGAEELMYKMADSSIEGRSALVNTVCHYYSPNYHEKTTQVLEKYMDFNEQKTGTAYDSVFSKLKTWPYNEQTHFMNRFVKSAVCKFCPHRLTGYLGEIASVYPNDCLRWILDVYNQKKGREDWAYNATKLIDVLIAAYNSIRKYDKKNPALERALDILDQWLLDNANRQYLFRCFNLLDN